MTNLTNSQTITISEHSIHLLKPEFYTLNINSKKPIIPQIINFLNSEFPDYSINFKINSKSIKFQLFQFNNSEFFKTDNYFKYKIQLSEIL